MHGTRTILAAAMTLGLIGPASAQAFKPRPSPVQAEVDAAVNRALAALKTMKPGSNYHKGVTGDELLLYALTNAGIPHGDPVFQQLLKTVVDREPAHTYSASLAAMCLAELDKAGYRWKLADIAQFLADNQCQNGQWSYGEAVPLPKRTVTPTNAPKAVASGPGGQMVKPATVALYGSKSPPRAPGSRRNTRALRPILIKQRNRGPAAGDNSNSQYAALGLRACAEAAVFVEPKVVKDALNRWEETQGSDGGWDYKGPQKSYGSMTAGGLGAVVIYHWMLRKPWQGDRTVKKGMEWLSTQWDVTKNPGDFRWANTHWKFHSYYLYGVERAGMLYGSDRIGAHDWYDEGARYLLQNQNADGSWSFSDKQFLDTCFAVLFLRRATKVLPKVYTG
jgi:hypothetical protein